MTKFEVICQRYIPRLMDALDLVKNSVETLSDKPKD